MQKATWQTEKPSNRVLTLGSPIRNRRLALIIGNVTNGSVRYRWATLQAQRPVVGLEIKASPSIDICSRNLDGTPEQIVRADM